MKNQTKLSIALTAAGLSLASFDSMAAATTFAVTGVGANAKKFASEAITAGTAGIVNSNITANSGVGSVANGSQVTFTLPTGVTFFATPAGIGNASACATATLAGGGAGTSSVTYTLTGVGTAGTVCSVSLGDFTINGATALATAGANLSITAQFSADTSASTVFATSQSELSLTTIASNVGINVASPANATRFVVGGNTIATSGEIAQLGVSNATDLLAANGVNSFTFTSTTASVTVANNYTGITPVYLAAAGACAATPPAGAITGTLANGVATFAGITPGATAAGAATITSSVCAVATGTTILPARVTGGAITASQQTTTLAPAAALTGTAAYAGGNVITIPYVVGSGSGYASYIRVTNPTGASSAITAVVNNDNGTVNSGALAALAAGNNTLYSISDVNTATGSSLTNPSQRATISILGATGITAEGLQLNPDGSVVPFTSIGAAQN